MLLIHGGDSWGTSPSIGPTLHMNGRAPGSEAEQPARALALASMSSLAADIFELAQEATVSIACLRAREVTVHQK